MASDDRRRSACRDRLHHVALIAHKAFPDESDFAAAKVGIFLASLIAGGLGTVLLWRAANDRVAPTSTAFRK